jgi:hypothetical protein
MGDNLEFRIEFLDQSQAAIEIKMRASEARLQYGEILLFACLALRQTNNMGIHHPVSRSLGGALPPGCRIQRPLSRCSWGRPSSQGNGSMPR